MSAEKYEPTPEEIQEAKESMTVNQAASSFERENRVKSAEMFRQSQERKEKTREIMIEVLREYPQLARQIIAGNAKLVRYFMEEQPTLTLEKLGSVESIKDIPTTDATVNSAKYGKKWQQVPTFEDLKRVDLPTFLEFTRAFAEVIKDKEFYLTKREEESNYITGRSSIGLLRESPLKDDGSLEYNFADNNEKLILKSIFSPEREGTSTVMYYLKKEFDLVKLGSFKDESDIHYPHVSVYAVRGKKEEK